MKRGDLVYCMKFGRVMRIVDFATPKDETLAIAAYVAPRPDMDATITATWQLHFTIVNASDVVPIEVHPALDKLADVIGL